MDRFEMHKKIFPARPASAAELRQRDAAKVEAVFALRGAILRMQGPNKAVEADRRAAYAEARLVAARFALGRFKASRPAGFGCR